jgi:hypothetical protein
MNRFAVIFVLDPGSRDGAARHAVRGTRAAFTQIRKKLSGFSHKFIIV